MWYLASLVQLARSFLDPSGICPQFDLTFCSRSAVIRGRVVTKTGRGLIGVRVTHNDLHSEGYTMTQSDGWFDFMVNGGGAVSIQFGKSPFGPAEKNLFVPWNEVRETASSCLFMSRIQAFLGTCLSCLYFR